MNKTVLACLITAVVLTVASCAVAAATPSQPALSAPTNLICTVSSDCMYFDWDDVAGAKEYVLEVDVLSSGTWEHGSMVNLSFRTGDRTDGKRQDNSNLCVPIADFTHNGEDLSGSARAKVYALGARGKSEKNPHLQSEAIYFPLRLTVATDKGRIAGLDDGGTVIKFIGVPYAAPPTGALRFRPPQPHEPWEGTLNTIGPCPVCPQALPIEVPAGGTPADMDEDCLYLNIVVPKSFKANMPVYVYFHGGGFAVGSGGEQDGTAMASTGMVVVTANYRLGLLGFMAHRALEDKPGDSGCYGLQDQQEALRWVKTNIANFGGDPSNVTIGGCSAGGFSVCSHLIMPGSEGLFQKGIIESLACTSTCFDQEDKYIWHEQIPSDLGCTSEDPEEIAEFLRSDELDIDDVIDVYKATCARVPRGGFLPGVGSTILPVHFCNGLGKVPLLIGCNTEEMGFYLSTNVNPQTKEQYLVILQSIFGDEVGAKVAAAYPFVDYMTGWEQLVITLTDAPMEIPLLKVEDNALSPCQHIRTLQLAKEAGGICYGYIFADSAPSATPGVPDVPYHGSQVQYLFPPGPSHALADPGNNELSGLMIAYWSNFIATGNPNSDGLPYWPAYQTPSDVMQLKPYAVHTIDADAAHKCMSFWQPLWQPCDKPCNCKHE